VHGWACIGSEQLPSTSTGPPPLAAARPAPGSRPEETPARPFSFRDGYTTRPGRGGARINLRNQLDSPGAMEVTAPGGRDMACAAAPAAPARPLFVMPISQERKERCLPSLPRERALGPGRAHAIHEASRPGWVWACVSAGGSMACAAGWMLGWRGGMMRCGVNLGRGWDGWAGRPACHAGGWTEWVPCQVGGSHSTRADSDK
jgi:hypothetical protein